MGVRGDIQGARSPLRVSLVCLCSDGQLLVVCVLHTLVLYLLCFRLSVCLCVACVACVCVRGRVLHGPCRCPVLPDQSVFPVLAPGGTNFPRSVSSC